MKAAKKQIAKLIAAGETDKAFQLAVQHFPHLLHQMKFQEIVKSYQKALLKKSRFFSSLMLLSGICIVATALFLSYEVSKIEC